MTNSAQSASTKIPAGDGCFSFIANPSGSNMIWSSQEGAFSISTNGGVSQSALGNSTGNFKGDFVAYADYDNTNDVLYSIPVLASTGKVIRRKNIFSGTFVEDFLSGPNLTGASGLNGGRVTCITVSPNTPSTIYLGTDNGRVVKIIGTNTLTAIVPSANIKYMNTGSLPGGVISNIEILKNASLLDDEILATYSNYGVPNRVWSSTNGTASIVTWTNATGNFPDLPIWWTKFAPSSNSAGIKLLLATELGVWSTDIISGNTTSWVRFDKGMPNVRTTMLKVNPATNNYIASTMGRGIYRTDIFSSIKVNFKATNSTLGVDCALPLTDLSAGATSWAWDFNLDGVTDATTQNPTAARCGGYGEYIRLTINGQFSVVKKLSDLVTFSTTLACGPPCGGGSQKKSNTSNDYNTESELDEVLIYPNPASSEINIKSTAKIISFEIFSNIGSKIIHLTNFNFQTINVSEVPKGLYYCKYFIGEKYYTKKIIIN